MLPLCKGQRGGSKYALYFQTCDEIEYRLESLGPRCPIFYQLVSRIDITPPALKEKGKNNIHLGTFKCKTKQTQISYHMGLAYNGHLFNRHYMCLVCFFLHASLSFCISQVHGQKKRKEEMHLQFYLKFIQLLKCFLTFSFDVKLLGAVDNFKLSQSSQMIERASPVCFP